MPSKRSYFRGRRPTRIWCVAYSTSSSSDLPLNNSWLDTTIRPWTVAKGTSARMSGSPATTSPVVWRFCEKAYACGKRNLTCFEQFRGSTGLMLRGKHVTQQRRVLQGEADKNGGRALQFGFEGCATKLQGPRQHPPELFIALHGKGVQRQLLFPINDNYFSLRTTFTAISC